MGVRVVSNRSTPKWPDEVWLIRHGQSAGNVARDHAEEAGLPLIDIATRDMDACRCLSLASSRPRLLRGG
jgi:hypothetical protein